MAVIPEPAEPEYFLDAYPRDAFPVYDWDERPATMPRRSGRPRRPTATASRAACRSPTEQSLAHLRHPVPLHRRLGRDPPGRVLRLPALGPRRAGGRARTLSRRRADRADDLDSRDRQGRRR